MGRGFSNRPVVVLAFAAALVSSAVAVFVASRHAGGSVDSAAEKAPTNIPPCSLIRDMPQATGGAGQTPEDIAVSEMQKALDEGRELEAVKKARELMDSDRADIRSAALETFGWIGKSALPEISEMLNDEDPGVRAEALQSWDMAFGELSGQNRQAAAIEDAVSRLKREDEIDAILLHAADLDEHVVLPLLSRIIEKGNASIAAECGREMYSHITGGEIYVSPAATAELLKTHSTSTGKEEDRP
jgi:hypothetical protein